MRNARYGKFSIHKKSKHIIVYIIITTAALSALLILLGAARLTIIRDTEDVIRRSTVSAVAGTDAVSGDDALLSDLSGKVLHGFSMKIPLGNLTGIPALAGRGLPLRAEVSILPASCVRADSCAIVYADGHRHKESSIRVCVDYEVRTPLFKACGNTEINETIISD